MHKADLINVGLACNAKFIMSCSKDTHVVVWSTKGEHAQDYSIHLSIILLVLLFFCIV